MKPRVKKVVNCGNVRWLADLRCFDAGRKYFESQEDAITHWHAKAREVRNHGIEALNLSHEDRVEFLYAKEKLKPLAVRITDAVEFYLKHNRGLQSRTLKQAFDEFIAAKRAAGKRSRYVAMLGYSIGRFVERQPDVDCTAIIREQIETWLYKSGFSPRTIRGYLIDAITFFGFCQKRGYISLNPCVGIEPVMLDEAPPGILTVLQCEALMKAARDEFGGRMLPYITLALFAGIRPEEAEKLTWDKVQIDRGFVEVPGVKAKSRKRGLVLLSENAKAWLRLGGPLPPMNKKRWLIEVRLKAGIQTWPKDCLRHSFGSYHLAMHGSADKTATQMRHYSTDMLFKHYCELVTKDEAEKFWSIRPAAESLAEQVSSQLVKGCEASE